MVWRIRVDWLPDGDESRATELAHGRICHLEKDGDRANYHAYFEAMEVPMASESPPYYPDDPRRTYHRVAAAVVEDYPRYGGSVWDLIGTALAAAGRGRPITHGGLRLGDIPRQIARAAG